MRNSVGRKASHSRIDFGLTKFGAISTIGGVYRPLVTFRLLNTENGLHQDFEGIVDTGAPYCLLPAWMGEAVEHNIKAASEKVPVSVAGAQKAEGWLHRRSQIQIMYREEPGQEPKYWDPIECPVVFCPDFQKESPRPIALLEQMGFMDNYDLYFSQSKKSFSIIVP